MTFHRILIIAIFAIAFQTNSFAQVSLGKTETGSASYYSTSFHGKKTSFGEIYNSNELSVAHRTYPYNTMLEVKNLDNNETVIVRVNDRGPFIDNRLVDLSKKAARQIGIIEDGVANVSVKVIGMEGMILLDEDEEIDPKSGKIVSMLTKD